MFRGYQRFVSLALSVCFILSMLFLNTLDVSAANLSSNSFTFNTLFYPNGVSDNTFGSFTGGGGNISSGTGTIRPNSGQILSNTQLGYSYHVKVPFVYHTTWDNMGTTGNYYDNVNNYFSIFPITFNVSTSVGTISNVSLYTADGTFLRRVDTNYTNSKVFYLKGTELQQGDASEACIPFILEYDFAYERQKSVGVTSSPLDSVTSTISVYVELFSRVAVDSEVEQIKQQVTDSKANQSLDSIESSSETTASNSGGILSKITEFFGSFFSNLIGVFVPEEGYFSNWFTRLNTLLADKLGMLYAPFDLLIQVLTSILNADDSFVGIPFPGIEWDGQYLIEPFTFTFSSLGDVYTDLQGYVYFGTDVILLLAFFGLLQDKIKHILED